MFMRVLSFSKNMAFLEDEKNFFLQVAQRAKSAIVSTIGAKLPLCLDFNTGDPSDDVAAEQKNPLRSFLIIRTSRRCRPTYATGAWLRPMRHSRERLLDAS